MYDSNAVTDTKHTTVLTQLRNELKEIPEGNTLEFLHNSMPSLEATLSSVYRKSTLYKLSLIILLAFTSVSAQLDSIFRRLFLTILALPAPYKIKRAAKLTFSSFSFGNIAMFIHTKFYAFKQAPQNSTLIKLPNLSTDIYATYTR